jgi:hypothetical protein
VDFKALASMAGGANMAHNVGVVLEDQNFLGGGGADSGRSDSNDGSVFEMWELGVKGKGVVNTSGGILKLKFTVVLINTEHLDNFSVDIEIIIFFFVANVKSFSLISTFNVVIREIGLGPVSEFIED